MIISCLSRIITKGNTNKILNSFLFSNKCKNNNNNNNNNIFIENKSNCFEILYKSYTTINNKDDEKVKSKIKESKKSNINDTALKRQEKKKLKDSKIKKESDSQFNTVFKEHDNNDDQLEYQFITVPTKFKEYSKEEEEQEQDDEEGINGGIFKDNPSIKEEQEDVNDIKNLKKPIPPTNLCCGSGCGSSCVWEVYFNEMDEYNKKLKKIDPNAKESPPDTSDDNEDPMQYFLKMERYNSMLQRKQQEEREQKEEKEREEKENIMNKDKDK
ncbi:hypothetical protein ACTFIU_005029 [Dictyostelium citrinum]